MREVTECLIDWLNTELSDEKPHRIMRSLADITLNHADLEESKRRFTAEEIVASVEGFPKNTDAKKWIDWSNSFSKYWEIREPQLIEFARTKGVQCYPKSERYSPKGGRGNYATFFIKAIPLPEIHEESNSENSPTEGEPEKTTVHYEIAANGEVIPSWFSKPLFNKGQIQLKNWHSWIILGWICSILLFTVSFSYITWITLSTPQPITTREITLFISTFIFPYVIWISIARPWVRLFDDRIVQAHELFINFHEKAAQFELLRDGDLRIIRLVRYFAPCPICGATINLEDGAPDFRRRLVGRCYESPREHVFSFDRVTRRGRLLITH
ncbi:MAG: hypothetical protein ABSB19_05930 [Methylomonas sp.]